MTFPFNAEVLHFIPNGSEQFHALLEKFKGQMVTDFMRCRMVAEIRQWVMDSAVAQGDSENAPHLGQLADLTKQLDFDLLKGKTYNLDSRLLVASMQVSGQYSLQARNLVSLALLQALGRYLCLPLLSEVDGENFFTLRSIATGERVYNHEVYSVSRATSREVAAEEFQTQWREGADLSKDQLKLTAVVAIGQNRVIGKDGGLPWGKLPGDMAFFKSLTLGNVVVQGRQTFSSILTAIGKPLPDRSNVVISKDLNYEVQRRGDVIALSSPPRMKDLQEITHPGQHVFIIGGQTLYELYLPVCDELIVTHVFGDHSGDCFFPEYDQDFRLVEIILDTKQYRICRYVRDSFKSNG